MILWLLLKFQPCTEKPLHAYFIQHSGCMELRLLQCRDDHSKPWKESRPLLHKTWALSWQWLQRIWKCWNWIYPQFQLHLSERLKQQWNFKGKSSYKTNGFSLSVSRWLIPGAVGVSEWLIMEFWKSQRIKRGSDWGLIILFSALALSKALLNGSSKNFSLKKAKENIKIILVCDLGSHIKKKLKQDRLKVVLFFIKIRCLVFRTSICLFSFFFFNLCVYSQSQYKLADWAFWNICYLAWHISLEL